MVETYDNEEKQEIAEREGFRFALMGEKASHAICRHGVIVQIGADNHTCGWIKLVEK